MLACLTVGAPDNRAVGRIPAVNREFDHHVSVAGVAGRAVVVPIGRGASNLQRSRVAEHVRAHRGVEARVVRPDWRSGLSVVELRRRLCRSREHEGSQCRDHGTRRFIHRTIAAGTSVRYDPVAPSRPDRPAVPHTGRPRPFRGRTRCRNHGRGARAGRRRLRGARARHLSVKRAPTDLASPVVHALTRTSVSGIPSPTRLQRLHA